MEVAHAHPSELFFFFYQSNYHGHIFCFSLQKSCKVHHFLKECFAWSSLKTIWWYLQLIFNLTSADISCKHHQIVSSEDPVLKTNGLYTSNVLNIYSFYTEKTCLQNLLQWADMYWLLAILYEQIYPATAAKTKKTRLKIIESKTARKCS